MNTPDTTTTVPQWPVPTTAPAHDPALFARAMRDMRLTWRARGILAELTTGYTPGQGPTVSELVSSPATIAWPPRDATPSGKRSVNCAPSATSHPTPPRPPVWANAWSWTSPRLPAPE